MKFKVGDKVRVRTLESLIAEFGGNGKWIELPKHDDCITGKMMEYLGKVVTIKEYFPYDDSYSIKELGSGWAWYDCCF